jgi:hypothetical protein
MKQSDFKLIKDYNNLSSIEKTVFFSKHEDEIYSAYVEFCEVLLYRPIGPDSNKKIHMPETEVNPPTPFS